MKEKAKGEDGMRVTFGECLLLLFSLSLSLFLTKEMR